jgi:FkbM family methyltransferase
MTTLPFDLFIDPRFREVYQQHPLVLVDVGARGGLKRNWHAARQHLHVLGFEPDKREYDRLTSTPTTDPATTWFDVALSNRTGPIRLHIARDRGLTSIFEPDRAFLNTFPQADRFDTADVQQVDADRLDALVEPRGVTDVDFLKVDTQGSELLVLEGAAQTLDRWAIGVEVEVEFTPIYREQPVFADVDRWLRTLGFMLFDLRPCYWKRAAGSSIGGPRGQIIWADALYLKSVPSLRSTLDRLEPATRKAKLLKTLSITVLYGYFDYALEVLNALGELLTPEERTLVDRWLRTSGGQIASSPLPGQRFLASVLHRLWKLTQPRAVDPDAWSVSDAELGNLR